jgi:TrmH family RNA methyltransferase
LRRLARDRRERDEQGRFVVEGPKLVEVALAAGWVEQIFVTPELLERYDSDAEHPVALVERGVLDKVLDTVTAQGVAAIARARRTALEAVSTDGPIVVLAGVADPGNAGTLVRTAEAVGASAVLFCDESVDPFSPKCVRASAGSIFHVPVVSGGGSVHVLEHLGARKVRRLGTTARAGAPYYAADLRPPVALVLGSESHGLPGGVDALLDGYVHIPMQGGIESLNVGVAGSVLLFEAARQASSARGTRGA